MPSTPIRPDEITRIVANLHTQNGKGRHRKVGGKGGLQVLGFVAGSFPIRPLQEELVDETSSVESSELWGARIHNQLDDYLRVGASLGVAMFLENNGNKFAISP